MNKQAKFCTSHFQFFWLDLYQMYLYQSGLLRLMQCRTNKAVCHHNAVIMGAMSSQITSLTIVYSTVHSGADQRKHRSSASLAFVRGIHRWPVNSPHKGQYRGKCFHLITSSCIPLISLYLLLATQSKVFPYIMSQTPFPFVLLFCIACGMYMNTSYRI